MGDKTRIGILISGRGSNLAAIVTNIHAKILPDAEISVVISNKINAKGVLTARQHGIQTMVVRSKGMEREEHERQVVAILKNFDVGLVCLAGYMRILSPWFVRQFPNRILNIHPSLLPAFPGENAHRDVLEYGVKISGCTVHIVDEEVDHGPIVIQKAVPVMDDDTEEKLAARILKSEHTAYSEAINLLLQGNFKITGRRLVKDKK